MKSWILTALLSMCAAYSWAQQNVQLDELNTAIEFANESDHGLLIVHRLLENYNQDINKYVDLESYKINHYTNKELPSNIFQDEENWFYDTSPLEWYDIGMKKIKDQGIKKTMTEMKDILLRVNQLRFDLDELIEKDLTDTSALNRVYDALESGVDMYDNFYELHKKLSSQVRKIHNNKDRADFPSFHKAMTKLYNASTAVLLAVREKRVENILELIENQQMALSEFESINLDSYNSTRMMSRKMSRLQTKIVEQGKLSIKSIKRFVEDADIPEEHRQYGKFYHYYNSEIINKYNRYGNGLVEEMNNVIEYLDFKVLKYNELPHYYKVVYPRNLERIQYISSTNKNITTFPKKLKERDIVLGGQKMVVDSDSLEMYINDHKIVDGDIISFMFNGEWIIEKMPITAEKRLLRFKLNLKGRNYFILHAENVGRQPPNTLAISYAYKGVEKQIILESDLNVSELIEIEIEP